MTEVVRRHLTRVGTHTLVCLVTGSLILISAMWDPAFADDDAAWKIPTVYALGDANAGDLWADMTIGPEGQLAIVCALSGEALAVYAPTGQELWASSPSQGDSYCGGAPIFDAEGDLFVWRKGGDGSATLVKFGADGTKLWEMTSDLGNDGILLGTDGNVWTVEDTPFICPRLRAYSPTNGERLVDTGMECMGDWVMARAFDGGIVVEQYSRVRTYNYDGNLVDSREISELSPPYDWGRWGDNAWRGPEDTIFRIDWNISSNDEPSCSALQIAKTDANGLLWTTPIQIPVEATGCNVEATATPDGGLVVVLHGGAGGSWPTDRYIRLISISASGEVRWEKDPPFLGDGWSSFAEPGIAIDSDGRVVVTASYWHQCKTPSGTNYYCIGSAALLSSVETGAFATLVSIDEGGSPGNSLPAWAGAIPSYPRIDNGRLYLSVGRGSSNGIAWSMEAHDVPQLSQGYLYSLLHPGVLGTEFVAMGDSYSSGEGVPPFDEGTATKHPENQCHRSASAYPRLLHNYADIWDDVRHVACSGAKIQDLFTRYQYVGQDPQVFSLDEHTAYVSLTIGGNDLEFVPIIKACVRNRDCAKAKNAEVTKGLKDLRVELPKVYSKIQSKAPNATVLILDYPALFPNPNNVALRNCHDLRLFRSGTLLKISVHEVKWLRRIGKELNSVIRKSAREADVAFVEVGSSLAGHEVCTSEPWVRGLTERHLEFSFHPLAEGHDAIAEATRDQVIGVIPGF